MRLAESVQHRFLGVVPHSRGANLVDRHARHFNASIEADIFRTCSFEHFCSGHAGVAHQSGLVLPVGHTYAQRGNTPRIFKIVVDLAEVIEVGQ